MLSQVNSLTELVRAHDSIYPATECIHIASFALLVGTIAATDFSLLGIGGPLCAMVASSALAAFGYPAGTNVTIPAAQWANAGKTHVPRNYTGVQALRDLPKFVRLIERGQFDVKSMVGRTFGPDKMQKALQVAADPSASHQ